MLRFISIFLTISFFISPFSAFARNGFSSAESSATTTSLYDYDGLDRLLQGDVSKETSTSTTGTISNYTYSSIGNILTSPAGTYVYAGNQGSSYANPHAATSIGTMTLVYDQNGNLLTRSDSISHTWDYNNRLVKITYPGQSGRFSPMSAGGSPSQFNKYVTYGYDAGGARISAKPWGVATTTFATASFNSDGSKQTVHLFANGSSLATIEQATSTPQIFWNSEDHLQSTSLVTSGMGNVVEEAQYTPFGSLKSDTGSHREQRKFTSHEFDDHAPTKYTYAQARYLNTEWGRFLSQDRAFIAAGDARQFQTIAGVPFEAYLLDPQLQNSYGYARNNPIKFIDPSGEFIFLAPLLIIYGVPAIAAAAAFVATYPVLAGMIGNAAIQQPVQTSARLTPGIGDVIDVSEALTGQDAFSGDPLSAGDRALSGATAILPFVSAGVMRAAGEGTKLNTRFISNLDGTITDLKPTLDRIDSGFALPYRNDGTIFENRPLEGQSNSLLPVKSAGYYREFVHETPRVNGSGSQRIIVGQNGEKWFTPDHYKTFIPIQ